MFQSCIQEVITTGFIFRSLQILPFIPRSLSSPTRKLVLRYNKAAPYLDDANVPKVLIKEVWHTKKKMY